MEQITAWRAWERYIVGLFLMLESVYLSMHISPSLSVSVSFSTCLSLSLYIMCISSFPCRVSVCLSFSLSLPHSVFLPLFSHLSLIIACLLVYLYLNRN